MGSRKEEGALHWYSRLVAHSPRWRLLCSNAQVTRRASRHILKRKDRGPHRHSSLPTILSAAAQAAARVSSRQLREKFSTPEPEWSSRRCLLHLTSTIPPLTCQEERTLESRKRSFTHPNGSAAWTGHLLADRQSSSPDPSSLASSFSSKPSRTAVSVMSVFQFHSPSPFC